MKCIQKFRVALILGFFVLFIAGLSLASDLIEPSRSLKSIDNRVGKLTISSNPPRLNVKMDGTLIGETPVVLQEVEPGIHTIQVKDAKTEIYVGPGKSLKLSWFEGAFIEIPVETKERPRQQSTAKREVPRKVKSERSANEIQLEPLYWPLNPEGQIF